MSVGCRISGQEILPVHVVAPCILLLLLNLLGTSGLFRCQYDLALRRKHALSIQATAVVFNTSAAPRRWDYESGRCMVERATFHSKLKL